jgi:anti-anti-sigma factor
MTEVNLTHQAVQPSPKVLSLRIAGEVDEGNGRKVEEYFNNAVKAEEPCHVLLDLSGLTFAGSAFFSSLVFWQEEMVKRGGTLVLFGLRPEVASTMRILTLDRRLIICPDQATALARTAKA